MKPVLVFDMDGVLVDVSDSYLATIAATVAHFVGRTPAAGAIARYKNAGGWNNDWMLAHQLIKDAGNVDVVYEEVVEIFQRIFLGDNNDGLITRERWIPEKGLLEKLGQSHALAIFSGRPRQEIEVTLARFAPQVSWTAIVGDMETPRPKPAPDGLHAIAAAHAGSKVIYVGDNVDDARSARAAGVRFIGIADDSGAAAEILQREGASVILRSVNELERVL